MDSPRDAVTTLRYKRYLEHLSRPGAVISCSLTKYDTDEQPSSRNTIACSLQAAAVVPAWRPGSAGHANHVRWVFTVL